MSVAHALEIDDASVQIRDLWMRFGPDTPWVHRGIDLEVPAGESLVVIGGSGSGKSTLLRLLVGLECPERGDIQVAGVDVAGADRRTLYALMAHVGVLFQFGALFDSLTVWENVTFALKDTGLPERDLRQIAREKLQMVGLHGILDQLPGALSGGMRKRVGLARAIAHEPRILFCDEPTSGLDPVMSGTISELIAQMRDRLGVTIVTITHDMRSAYTIADRIAMLYRGRIHAWDVPEAIRASRDPIVRQFIQGRALGPTEESELGEAIQ
ncbi:MAG: ABC transporter ATP-binding protein [Myxococcota bacterium]